LKGQALDVEAGALINYAIRFRGKGGRGRGFAASARTVLRRSPKYFQAMQVVGK
jgi:hypothetical protein